MFDDRSIFTNVLDTKVQEIVSGMFHVEARDVLVIEKLKSMT